MQNPFTTTFSKKPIDTYVNIDAIEKIIENFQYDFPSKSVYKITGVRGSGKTVLLLEIVRRLKAVDNNFIFASLTTSRDMLLQLLNILQYEFNPKKEKISRSFSFSTSILGSGASIGYVEEINPEIKDIGIEIEKYLKVLKDENKKLLIVVDEVLKTNYMMVFASEFNKWLYLGYPVYFICTGLYNNIMKIGNVANLTFFKRAVTVKMTSLNLIRMTEMYKLKLKLNHELAYKMAQITKGYAYAFQKLGSLYFEKKENDTLDDIIPLLKSELFAFSYCTIWDELTDEERTFVLAMKDKDSYKREELLINLKNKALNYSVYRDRLLSKGIIIDNNHSLSFALPYFIDYVNDYCS